MGLDAARVRACSDPSTSSVYVTGKLRISALGFAVVFLPTPGGYSAQIEGVRLVGQLYLGEAPAAVVVGRAPAVAKRFWDPARIRLLREGGRSGYAAALWNAKAKGFRVWRARGRSALGARAKRA